MNSDERRQAIELEIRNFGAAAARKDYLGVAGFFTEDAKGHLEQHADELEPHGVSARSSILLVRKWPIATFCVAARSWSLWGSKRTSSRQATKFTV